MTDIGTRDAVDGYLSSVRAALSDLPEAEVGEILDDVGPHVAEVAQELLQEGRAADATSPETADGTAADQDVDLAARLRERLGDPERYAAELRAAAGYPPRPSVQAEPGQPSLLLLRLSLYLLVLAIVLALFAGGEEQNGLLALLFLAMLLAGASLLVALRLPGGTAELVTLPELRWLHSNRPSESVQQYVRLLQHGWWLARAGVVAMLVSVMLSLDLGALLALLVVPFAIASAWLGLRSQADRRLLWLVLPLNALALSVAVPLLNLYDFSSSSRVVYVPEPSGGFVNVYPYDSTGKPLTGVYLYDENGRPLAVSPDSILGECLPDSVVPAPANQYPRPVYVFDRTGRCVPAPSATLTPPLPSPTSAPTASAPTTSAPTTSAPPPAATGPGLPSATPTAPATPTS